ncbi:MAG: anaerobic ribonucleoside-triphosphate reductase, partial [Candidatus Ranarchaeia archaeon]
MSKLKKPVKDKNIILLLSAVSQGDRVEILRSLVDIPSLTFTQLMQKMNLDPKKDAGKFTYHLKSLIENELINRNESDTSGYSLTPLGRVLIDLMDELEEARKSIGLKVKTSRFTIEDFNRDKIKKSLVNEAGIRPRIASRISKEAEERLLKFKIHDLTAPLIREIVNSILLEKGMEKEQQALARVGLPIFDVQQILEGKSKVNFSPETIHKIVGDVVLQQYLIRRQLSEDVADAHLNGYLQIEHGSYWLTRPWNLTHDPRIFFRYGLKSINSQPSLNPPSTFLEAILFITRILQMGQTNIAGEQTIDHFNTFLAPFLNKKESQKQLRKYLRILLESINLVPVGRGGIPVSATLLIDLTVPKFLQDTPIYMENNSQKGVYGDFSEESQIIISNLFDVLLEGDSNSRPFSKPTIILKIQKEDFEKETHSLLDEGLQLAKSFSNILFANVTPEWQKEDVVYNGNNERIKAKTKRDWEIGTLRTGILDSIVLNLPRLAIESRKNESKFFEILNNQLAIMSKALNKKREIIQKQIETNKLPFLSSKYNDETYYRFSDSSLVFSYVGLPESIQHLCSAPITSKNGLNLAVKILRNFEKYCRKMQKETNWTWRSGPISNQESAIRLAEFDRLSTKSRRRKVPDNNKPYLYS